MGRSEKIARIQCAIAQELERGAMNLIRPRFRNDVDYASCRIPILGSEIRGLEVEFLKRVGIWERKVHVDVGVIVVGTVELIVDVGSVRAVDAGYLLTRINSSVAADSAILAGKVHNTGSQK